MNNIMTVCLVLRNLATSLKIIIIFMPMVLALAKLAIYIYSLAVPPIASDL